MHIGYRLRLRFSFRGMMAALVLAASVVAAPVLAGLAIVPGSAWAQLGRAAVAGGSRTALLVDMSGAIGVGAQQHIEAALAHARQENVAVVVLRLDTPGGLVTATRDIIQSILASRVPVITFVAPSGARAASAGTYIAYASHVAAMAPGTHLGAATPIQIGAPGMPAPQAPNREPDKPGDGAGSAMERKVVNDAVAYLKSLAQLRGRNADWAEKAVREAATLTAGDALRERVVDVVASDVADLLQQVDGRQVSTASGDVQLVTRNAVLSTFERSWKTRMIGLLTDPNLAFILLMIGVYGIIFELWSPGLTGPGIVGAIALLLALTALSMLPVSAAGLGLLALGVALMIAETVAPGFGILGLGGVAAFALGAVFLFDPAGADIDFAVAWPLVLSATLTSALFLIGLLGMVMRTRGSKVVTGAEEMLGLEGEVVSWSGGTGRVHVHGETWSARSARALAAGEKVRVVAREGLTLEVVAQEKRS